MTQLTIFSVATDRYLEFWLDLLGTAEQFIDQDLNVQWILFTNRENDIPRAVSERLGTNLVTVRFESSPWPMPTLLRYELLAKAADKIEGEIVMHLDADMLFAGSLTKRDLIQALGNQEIALVRHPGYFRPSKFAKVIFYLGNPRYILSDVKSWLLKGGIGSWEKNSDSLAFVSRENRKVYVCGATWFGRKNSVIDLCSSLSLRIQEDLSRNVIAKFHDESHLNWFAANNTFSLLSPKFCYDENYPQLSGIKPTLIAVEKGKGTDWERQ
jgi:hypothetical protein